MLSVDLRLGLEQGVERGTKRANSRSPTPHVPGGCKTDTTPTTSRACYRVELDRNCVLQVQALSTFPMNLPWTAARCEPFLLFALDGGREQAGPAGSPSSCSTFTVSFCMPDASSGWQDIQKVLLAVGLQFAASTPPACDGTIQCKRRRGNTFCLVYPHGCFRRLRL